MDNDTLLNIYLKAVENQMDRAGWNNLRLSENTGLSPAMIGRYLNDDLDKRSSIPLEAFLKIANSIGYEKMMSEVEQLRKNHNLDVSFQVLHTKQKPEVQYGVFLVDGKVVASGHLMKKQPFIYFKDGDKAILPVEAFLQAMKKGTGFDEKFESPQVLENEDMVEVNRFSYENWKAKPQFDDLSSLKGVTRLNPENEKPKAHKI